MYSHSKLINLPLCTYLIKDILDYYNHKIYLAGSGADHFLLNRSHSDIKDLDFMTKDTELIEKISHHLIKTDSRMPKEPFKYVSLWNATYPIEFFIVPEILPEDLYYCEELNFFIESKSHRMSIIDQILNDDKSVFNKDKFLQLKRAYQES